MSTSSDKTHGPLQGRPFSKTDSEAKSMFYNWYRLYVPEAAEKATITSIRPVLVPFFGFFADRGRQRVAVYGGYEFSDQQVESLKVDPKSWTKFNPTDLERKDLLLDTWSITPASAAHKASLDYPGLFDGPVPPYTQALLPGYMFEFTRRGQTFRVLVGAESGKASGLRHFSFWSGLWELFTFGMNKGNNSTIPFLLMLFPRLVPPIGLGLIVWAAFRAVLSPVVSGAAEKLVSKMPVSYRNTTAGGRVERIIAHQWGHYDPREAQANTSYAEQERRTFENFFRNAEEQFRRASSGNQQQQQQQQREYYEQYFRQRQQQQSSRGGSSYDNTSSAQSPPPSGDPYSVLGVNRNATSDELRQAFRKKLLQFHPDHFQGKEGPEFAKRKTQEIVDAYRSLSATAKRNQK